MIEGLPGPRQDHHRVFQSLALVDAHEAHVFFPGAGGLSGRHFRRSLCEAVDILQKTRQVAAGVLLVFIRPADQVPDVFLPPAAPWQGPRKFIITGFIRRLPAQVLQGEIPGFFAPPVQLLQGIPAFFPQDILFPLFRIGKEALRKEPFLPVDPHRRQFRGGVTENR